MLILALSLGLFVSPYKPPACKAASQTSDTGRLITGQVLDPTGAVVPKAKILIRSNEKNFAYTQTDSDGCFQVLAPTQSSELDVRAPGFQTFYQDLPEATPTDTSKPILIHLLVLNPAPAASFPDHKLRGSVTVCVFDPAGVPVEAKLSVQSNSDELEKLALLTGRWGCSTFEIPKDSSTFSISADGFRTLNADLPKDSGENATMNLTLQPLPPSQ